MVPFDVDLLQRAHRVVRRVGDHRHAARRAAGADKARGHPFQRHHLAHAGQRLGRLGVEAPDAAGQRRAHGDAGVQQARRQHVDAVGGGAVELAGVVDAPLRLTDDAEVGLCLELHRRGQRLLRGLCREFAEARAAVGGRVQHAAGLGAAFARGHLPLRRGRAHQHEPRRRAGLAHRAPLVGDARRAARARKPRDRAQQLAHDLVRRALAKALVAGLEGQRVEDHGLVVVDGVEAGLLEPHLRHRGVHFFGQQHRQAGVRALPHFRLRHHQRDGVVTAHLDPAVERDLPVARRQRRAGHEARSRRRGGPADDQGAGGAGGAEHEVAAFELGHGVVFLRWGLVVQRCSRCQGGTAMPCQKISKPASA